MSESPDAEKSLLFALLAFQNGFIHREQLLTAFGSWMADKSRPIDAILVEQAALSDSDRGLLMQLVARHIQHGSSSNDPQHSLLETMHTVRDALLSSSRGDAALSQAVQTLTGDETLPLPVSEGTMADEALSTNRFRLIREHASGGLGQVFLAEDTNFRRRVALKQIRREYAHQEEYRAKFLREAEVTGQLEHPGIVPVYALGEDDRGRPFYAMRYIAGEDLKSRIKQVHRSCPVGKVRLAGPALRQLLRHLIDACHAISYAHDRGVLHRDLKPSNIMLGKHGETLVVDWGLAKPLGVKLNEAAPGGPQAAAEVNTEIPLGTSDTASGSETRYGSFVGTAAYAPPEQVLGNLDQLGTTSDVYSLGAILYELLAGQPPLVGKDVEQMIRKVTLGEIVPITQLRPDAPRELVAICRKAMALAQADRYQSVAEMRQDMQRWLDDLPVSAYRASWRQSAARWSRRHPQWVAGVLSAMVIGSAAIGISSLLIQQKNIDLNRKNDALLASQRLAVHRRQQAEAALYDGLVSQSQLLTRQAATPGWSWEVEQKLAQAAEIVPAVADRHVLRSLMLSGSWATDFRRLTLLHDEIDVAALSFSADGQYLAIGQRKHNLAASIFVYSTANWELAHKFSVSAADGGLAGLGQAAARLVRGERHQEGVLSLTFSPDGKWLMAGTRLGRIHAWQMDTSSPAPDNSTSASMPHTSWVAFEDGGVADIVISPGGDGLWTRSDGMGNRRCRGWNKLNGQWTEVTALPLAAASHLAGSGYGLLASISDGKLRWYDARAWKEASHATLPTLPARAVGLAAAAKRFALVNEGELLLGDLETGRTFATQHIAADALNGNVELTWDAAGQLLAVTGSAPQVTILATANDQWLPCVIPISGRNEPLATFSPTGQLLAVTAERGVFIYQRRERLPAYRPLAFPTGERVHDVALTHPVAWLLGKLEGRSAAGYQFRQFQPHSLQATRVSTLLCAAEPELPPASFLSGQPLRGHLWGRAIVQHDPASGSFRIRAATADSQLLPRISAEAQWHKPLSEYQPAEHECLNGPAATQTPELSQVGELQLTASGQAAFGISADGQRVLCLDATDFSVLGQWDSQLESNLTGNARPLSLSVSGEQAVVGGNDGFVHLLQTDGRVLSREQFSDGPLLSLAAASGHVAVGAFNGKAMLAAVDRLHQHMEWPAHAAPVTAVAITPDGSLIATGSRSGRVTLWQRQADGVQPLVSFPRATRAVQRLRFDPAGRHLAMIYEQSSTAHVWDLARLHARFAAAGVAW